MTTSAKAKPETRNPKPEIICRKVRTEAELRECYKIRRKVFVEEQKLFAKTDRNGHDAEAIHIAALQEGRVIGTVRIYQQEKGICFGGRLAVLKGFRGRAGKLLVDKAVETAKGKDAKRFLAYIQIKIVPFFKRCGWVTAGEVFEYHGVPHQLMEADLNKKGSRVKKFKGSRDNA
jgi:putative N-acetyltransferase (TIGR04045 family)